MEPLNGPFARWILLTCSIVLFLGFGIVGVGMERSAPQRRLAEAEARWAARPFSQYQLVLEGDHGRCRQEALVQNERVVKNVQNTCRVPIRTVRGLFRLVESVQPVVYRCVDLACACDTVVTVQTRYDSQFGYPQEISFRWTVRPNWLHRDFWRHVLEDARLPACRQTDFSRTVTVHSLTAVQ